MTCPALQRRLGEIDAEMAKETFWNNREQAQKLIDESNGIRRKRRPAEPGRTAARRPEGHGRTGRGRTAATAQLKLERELEQESGAFERQVDEARTADAAQRPARPQQLHPQHQRRRRRHRVVRLGEHAAADVPALGGDTRLGGRGDGRAAGRGGRHQERHAAGSRARTPTASPRPNAASTGWSASRRSTRTSAGTRASPAWT